MRIGIMMRSLDERGGIGVYTRGILEEPLAQGRDHEFVLSYRTPENFGRHGSHPNLTERVLRAPNQTLWDQVVVPPAWFDIFQIRRLIPLYVRKAATVISFSELTIENLIRVVRLPADKVKTIFFAAARHSRRVVNAEILAEVRDRYDLPERFLLTFTKPGSGGRRNFRAVREAPAHSGAANPSTGALR